MKRYRITEMKLNESEYSYLQSIGVDVGSEIALQSHQQAKHLCFISVDRSFFCLRRETMDKITVEEI